MLQRDAARNCSADATYLARECCMHLEQQRVRLRVELLMRLTHVRMRTLGKSGHLHAPGRPLG